MAYPGLRDLENLESEVARLTGRAAKLGILPSDPSGPSPQGTNSARRSATGDGALRGGTGATMRSPQEHDETSRPNTDWGNFGELTGNRTVRNPGSSIYLLAAVKLYSQALAPDSLELLHLLLILSLYSIFSPHGGSTWHLLGLAMQTALRLGLHQASVPDGSSTPRMTGHLRSGALIFSTGKSTDPQSSAPRINTQQVHRPDLREAVRHCRRRY